MTYRSPTAARALFSAWLARHPELASKTPPAQQAMRCEAWRRCLTAANRGQNWITMTADDYQLVMARLVSQLRQQRFGHREHGGADEWWSQVQGIAAEVGWTAPRHLFFIGERKQQEASDAVE